MTGDLIIQMSACCYFQLVYMIRDTTLLFLLPVVEADVVHTFEDPEETSNLLLPEAEAASIPGFLEMLPRSSFLKGVLLLMDGESTLFKFSLLREDSSRLILFSETTILFVALHTQFFSPTFQANIPL